MEILNKIVTMERCKECNRRHDPSLVSCESWRAWIGYFGSEKRATEYLHGTDIVKINRRKNVSLTDVHYLIIREKIVKWRKDISEQTRALIRLGFSEDFITSVTGEKPHSIECAAQNILLNEGIAEVLDIIGGLGVTTLYNAANARVGVGNGTAAAAATQTALQGLSTAFKPMAAGFPSRTAQTISFKGTDFGSADANFAWEEFTVDNGATPNKNLNRKVEPKGTKVSGETWTLQIDITLS